MGLKFPQLLTQWTQINHSSFEQFPRYLSGEWKSYQDIITAWLMLLFTLSGLAECDLNQKAFFFFNFANKNESTLGHYSDSTRYHLDSIHLFFIN